MWLKLYCKYGFVTKNWYIALAFLRKTFKDLTRKAIFQGCSWFNFNNLGVVLGAGLKFYTSKRVKTQSQKVFGPNSHACKSYSIKTSRVAFLLSPILIWSTVTMIRESHLHSKWNWRLAWGNRQGQPTFFLLHVTHNCHCF